MSFRFLVTFVLIVWTYGIAGCREVEFSGEKRDRDERSRDASPDGGDSGPGGSDGVTPGGDPERGKTGVGPGGCSDLEDCGSSNGGGPGGSSSGDPGTGGGPGTGTGTGTGSGGDGTIDGDGDAAAPEGDGAGGEETDEASCVDGDLLKARFAKDAQACLDSGRIYDFGGKRCSTLKVATKFPCSWSGLLAAVTELGLETPQAKLKSWRDGGGKIVACGEKDGGLVVQVVKNGATTLGKNCAATVKTAVLTACYESSSSATPGQSEEESVRACF